MLEYDELRSWAQSPREPFGSAFRLLHHGIVSPSPRQNDSFSLLVVPRRPGHLRQLPRLDAETPQLLEVMMRSRLLLPFLAPALTLSHGCTDSAHLTEPASPEAPAFVIADGARGFKQGFYWLPPMVRDPVTSGTFDAELSPEVEICALDAGECDPELGLIEIFTMDGSGSERVRVDPDGEHYLVNWHTDEYDLSEATHYRISVFAGPGVLLGYADVEPVSNGGALRNVDAGEYIGLVDGRTLPIKFRIRTGIVASISIDPGEATLPPGQTQQFTATVTDLHGNTLTAQVEWTSEDNNVATVDAGGAATAVGTGTTTITATLDQESASATLTVEPQGGWAQLSAGSVHTCGVTTDGAAFCWGGNFPNGQLGTGGTDGHLSPVAVTGDHEFASIRAGPDHTCGVNTDGAAFCWGLGATGRLGTGGTGTELSPVEVAGNHRFVSISVGNVHSCAVAVDGKAYCWGQGVDGRLGTGGTDIQLSPVAVAGNHQFASISAGQGHTCAVTTGGEAFCWGSGSAGGLGNGGTDIQLAPVAVAGNHQFASISAGTLGHTCGVTTASEAFCWGRGSFGKLGNGGSDNQLSPVAVAGNHRFASISAGQDHTCGVTTAGEALCWGEGSSGRLGTGGTGDQLLPLAVAGNHQFASISAGALHTCGVTADDEAYCWGRGSSGQLGDGLASVIELVPVLVSDPF